MLKALFILLLKRSNSQMVFSNQSNTETSCLVVVCMAVFVLLGVEDTIELKMFNIFFV